MPLPELLTWQFWTVEKSEVVRNFGLAAAGGISLFFLVWRAISSDISARAARRQAEAALRQATASANQSQASLKQSELAKSQAESYDRRHTVDTYIKSIELLGNQSDIVRTSAILSLSGVVASLAEYRQPVTDILSQYITDTAARTSVMPLTFQRDLDSALIGATLQLLDVSHYYAEYVPESIRTLIAQERGAEKLTLGSVELDQTANDFAQKLVDLMVDSHSTLTFAQKFHGTKTVRSDIEKALEGIGGISGRHRIAFSLRNSDLQGIHIVGREFWCGDFSRVDFRFGGLHFCKFSECFFVGTRFDAAMLVGVTFKDCVLSGAVFFGADLRQTSFQGCDLRGANFDMADSLNLEPLGDNKTDERTVLPSSTTVADSNEAPDEDAQRKRLAGVFMSSFYHVPSGRRPAA